MKNQERAKFKSFRSGRVSRFAHLGQGLLNAGKEYAKVRFSGDLERKMGQVRSAAEIVRKMAELKGGVMKIGQILSITDDLVLPPEVSAVFKSLQKDAPSMSIDDINHVFKESFNRLPLQVFKEFNYTPMAAASIGQVHKATLHNDQRVVVKVQYPQIDQAILNDFKNIDLLDQIFGLIFKSKPDLEKIIGEVKASLELECDYHHELERGVFASKVFEKDERVRIPKFYQEFSAKKILTMEYLQGDTFEQTKHYSQEQRDFLGQTLFDSFMYGLFNHHFVHADPQNGNYLFTPNQIILLDFGATKIFDSEFIYDHDLLLQSLEKNNFELYEQQMVHFGFFNSSERELMKRHFEMIKELYYPYTLEGQRPVEDINPFEQAIDFLKNIKIRGTRSPHPDFFYLDRGLLGLYTKIRGWNAKIDWVSSRNSLRSEFAQKRCGA